MKLFKLLSFFFATVFAQDGEGSGSGLPDDIQSEVVTTVEMELETEIEYDEKLEDKDSAEYEAKKEALYAELEPSLQEAAEVTNSELEPDSFDVTFAEVDSGRRKRRQDEVRKMKGTVSQKFISTRTEEFSPELRDQINNQVRAQTEAEVQKYTDAPDNGSLLTAGQDITATATSTGYNLNEWNAGAPLKMCSSVFVGLLALGLLN